MRLQGDLDRAHRRQHRNHASTIGIHADAEIDLVGAGIALIGFHQTQNRIAGIRREVCKHDVFLQ